MSESYDHHYIVNIIDVPARIIIEKNISEIHSIINTQIQNTLIQKTILRFWVNETQFTKIAKNASYDISTDWLNGCTSSIIILKNNKWELFLISSHFPPIDFMREKQLMNIKESFVWNKNQIWNIEQISIFSVADISRKNDDYQKIIDLIASMTWIESTNTLLKYNRFDFKRAEKEKLGKMNIFIRENWEINFFHEWRKI